MWGNRLGWIISFVILLAAIGLFNWIESQLAMTEPTALSLDPQNLSLFSPPQPEIPIADQNQIGDAGPIYRQALAAYTKDPDTCQNFAQNPSGPAPQPFKLLFQAAPLSSMSLFIASPSEIVDYQSDHAALGDLVELGHTVDRAALSLRLNKNLPEARQYFQAAYSLGSKLFNERLTYDEYLGGLGLMNEATAGLAECEPQYSALRSAYQQQEAAMVKFDQTHVLPVYQVLSSADQQVIATNAGDVFAFAAPSDSERMFRVEAILKLGRYRFDAARKGDQFAAPRVLKLFAAESDPAIQVAANAALGLTLEQYRTIH